MSGEEAEEETFVVTFNWKGLSTLFMKLTVERWTLWSVGHRWVESYSVVIDYYVRIITA